MSEAEQKLVQAQREQITKIIARGASIRGVLRSGSRDALRPSSDYYKERDRVSEVSSEFRAARKWW